jgi:hypothetical protein
VLALTLVVLLCAAVYTLARDPIVMERFQVLWQSGPVQTGYSLNIQELEKRDPPLGIVLPTSGTGAAIRKAVRKSLRGYFVVGLGDCGSCTSFNFKTWQEEADRYGVNLIGFSSGSTRDIAEYRRYSAIRAPIVQDAGQSLARTLNAYWNGRLYYFNTQWKLRWRMRSLESLNRVEQSPVLRALLEVSLERSLPAP